MLDFIVNPTAEKANAVLRATVARLGEGEYVVHALPTKEETRETVRRLTKQREARTLVAVGGDGTLNDVLSGVSDFSRLTLGLIPAGTGNDFAASARIPEGVGALDLILHGEPKPTDFIECDEGLRSMNIAGLGIDVDILERCARMKRGNAKSKYFKGLIQSLFHYRGQRIEVTADGKRFDVQAYIAAVCNGSQFGGGIPICPAATIDDGKLDLVVVSRPRRLTAPFELIRLMRGKILERPITRHILCDSARIVQTEGQTVQLDGEIVSSRTLTAHIVHGKLMMYRG